MEVVSKRFSKLDQYRKAKSKRNYCETRNRHMIP